MIFYFLSVDCAVKTFAYCVVKVDTDNLEYIKTKLDFIKKILTRPDLITDKILSNIEESQKDLQEKIQGYITIIAADVVNLIGDAPEHTVSVIRALNKYCRDVIMPNIPTDVTLNVLVEFQMGQNPSARTIMTALATIFIDHNVIIVGPSLKNKIYYTDEGQYCHFIAKYSSAYSANKQHTTFNFTKILQDIKYNMGNIKKCDLNHVADSFMQIFGYAKFGSSDEQY